MFLSSWGFGYIYGHGLHVCLLGGDLCCLLMLYYSFFHGLVTFWLSDISLCHLCDR